MDLEMYFEKKKGFTDGYCRNLKAKTLEKPRLSSYYCNERNRK